MVAAWTEHRDTLTVAVLNPTESEQVLELELAGAGLAGKGTLWRLASSRADAKDPAITSSAVGEIPSKLVLPRFSVSIYEFPVK